MKEVLLERDFPEEGFVCQVFLCYALYSNLSLPL